MSDLLPNPKFFVDIEIYDEWGDEYWAQAHYLFHGYDDVFWTNDLNSGMDFLLEQIKLGDSNKE